MYRATLLSGEEEKIMWAPRWNLHRVVNQRLLRMKWDFQYHSKIWTMDEVGLESQKAKWRCSWCTDKTGHNWTSATEVTPAMQVKCICQTW